MDWVTLRDRVMEFLNKYKYVALVLLLGLVLMAIPARKEKTGEVVQAEPITSEETPVSEELAQILSQIQGVGKVKVMLTLASGEETVYQMDEKLSTGQDSGSTQRDTVIITDSQRSQAGLVCQVNPPKYQGAIIVCQGADSPAVCLAIVEAVSNATGLGADRISVLKMK